MLETGRRTVINTSQLGLYSDNGDRYRRNRYNSITRKFVIGVMVVVIVVLVSNSNVILYSYDTNQKIKLIPHSSPFWIVKMDNSCNCEIRHPLINVIFNKKIYIYICIYFTLLHLLTEKVAKIKLLKRKNRRKESQFYAQTKHLHAAHLDISYLTRSFQRRPSFIFFCETLTKNPCISARYPSSSMTRPPWSRSITYRSLTSALCSTVLKNIILHVR